MYTMNSRVPIKPFAIFDMDGTLVDSMGCWNDVNLQYLASKGVTINKSVETLMATTAHMTTDESAALLCDMFLPDISAQEVADSLNARMETLYRTQIQEKPGIRAYIEQLKREDVRMC